MVVAEVGQAHDGSLGTAHAFIDAIADAGADAVKFQTHIADAESTPQEKFRVHFSKQDATRYDYWKRMEFTAEQWNDLAAHARKRGLIFLSSPFSLEAVELLNRVGVPAWKIASGEVSTTPILERIGETGLPILLSTGMSSLREIDEAVHLIRKLDAPFLILQCTTSYPCPPEKIGLNLMPFFKERYSCPVGLSDHSGTIYAGLAAASVGIDLLEVHVTLSREMFGPDVPASVTTIELQELVEGIRFIERMRANPVDKNRMAQELAPLHKLFSKSIVTRADLDVGTILQEEHLTMKKPGTGIPSNQLHKVIGRRLQQNVAANQLLSEGDLEEVT